MDENVHAGTALFWCNIRKRVHKTWETNLLAAVLMSLFLFFSNNILPGIAFANHSVSSEVAVVPPPFSLVLVLHHAHVRGNDCGGSNIIETPERSVIRLGSACLRSQFRNNLRLALCASLQDYRHETPGSAERRRNSRKHGETNTVRRKKRRRTGGGGCGRRDRQEEKRKGKRG